jgi:excisionase family DNA binding protein
MTKIEGPDEPITLKRAAELAGLTMTTLRDAARDGRLQASRPGHDWLTTRRHLHRYLAGRRRGVVKPLPAGYHAPEGEEPIA